MIDKAHLLKRLNEMLVLSRDWDGFGTDPITQKVFEIGKSLIGYIGDSVYDMKIFVSVNSPGGLYAEIDLTHKKIEMVVMQDGTVHWDELVRGKIIGGGSMIITKSTIDAILGQ